MSAKRKFWNHCNKCGLHMRTPYPHHNTGKGLTLKQRKEFKEKGLCSRCGSKERAKMTMKKRYGKLK